MHHRNLSPRRMFAEIAKEHVPLCQFNGKDKKYFSAWKKKTLPKVLSTIGDYPPRCVANPQLLGEWEHDSLRKQRWLIDIHPHASAVFLINYPLDMKKNEKRPSLLCWHGHGQLGKEPVMGNDSSAAMREAISVHNYSYGHQMAKAGFVTFAIDWMGLGERSESQPRNGSSTVNGGRDWCNLYYLDATMLGMTSISVNVMHGMLATDFACSLPGVDENRLGVMGLSGGGTMTVWSALCDERFKAVEIICYSDLWADFGFLRHNYCGMQVAPGLFKLVDLPDLQGLIAPRPLLVDIGAYDTCFPVGPAMQCFEQVKKIYAAAGAADRLELDMFPGEHSWGGNKSVEFFQKNL